MLPSRYFAVRTCAVTLVTRNEARRIAAGDWPAIGVTAAASLWLPRIFQSAFRRQHQAVGCERFLDKVVGAAFDGGNSRLLIAVTGDQHDRQFGMLLLEAIEQLKTIEPAALQPNVEENEIGPASNDSS